MSDFLTFNPLQNGNPRPGQQIIAASTTDGWDAVGAAGYMTDLSNVIEVGDIVYVKLHAGATNETFVHTQVSESGGVWSLTYVPEAYTSELNYGGGAAAFTLTVPPSVPAEGSVVVTPKTLTNDTQLYKALYTGSNVQIVMGADPGVSVFTVIVYASAPA